MLLIDESQVAFLEDMMWEQGFLDSRQMAGAFQMLRSNDLIWSRVVHDYLLGQRQPVTDLMAWNADATRMPYRMHSEYLRSFPRQRPRRGPVQSRRTAIALTDLRAPIFAVGTERDHVAPWRSTYKLILSETDVTYLLTTGGHNAGIVSPPDAGRSYRMATKLTDPMSSPDSSMRIRRIGRVLVAGVVQMARRKFLGDDWAALDGVAKGGLKPLADAPGTYVRQR